MPYINRDQLSTQDLILEVESVLTMVDTNLEALKLQNETYLRVEWAVTLIKALLGNRPYAVCTGFQRRSDARFVAMLLSDGTVSVWETDRYQLDRMLGIITPDTTRADVWRMRQQCAWIRANELGLVA
jgi:hypothetical protein